jgi:CRISPR-associated exonuclease Cas4
MEHGAEQHEVLAALERRRELLVVTEDNQYFPVEFKETTGRGGMNHRYQLAGYAVLIEEVYNAEVNTGFIYRIPLKRVTAVRVTAALKRRVQRALTEMRALLDAERMPPPTSQRGKCVDCEFRRFCSDVW